MSRVQLLNLDRFKRGATGVRNFAILLERAHPVVRESIIKRTASQDPNLLVEALTVVVFFEEIIYLQEGVLAEILSSAPAKLLAFALARTPDDFRASVLAQAGFRLAKSIADEEERFSGFPPLGLVLGARRQILKIARQLEDQGKLSLDNSQSPRLLRAKAA